MLRAAALLGCLIAAACSPEREERCASQTGRFLAGRQADGRRALARAEAWLDALPIDPIALRAAGLKGKKKLTEKLDGYVRLWRVAEPADRARIAARAREAAAVTADPRFHDLAEVGDEELKEDSTSYLRAALLMEQLGLDTRLYREEIRKAKPRIDAHLATRGAHQRLAFRWYYRHFGLEEPFPLDGAAQGGLVARRPDPASLTSRDAYRLAHEVFVPYEFGDRLDRVDPFDAGEKRYLEAALDLSARRALAAGDVDLLAELLSSLRYLRLVERPVYRDGIAYLLASQHQDGSWGDIAEARRLFGERAAEGRLLHSTTVVIEALAAGFHMPADLYPGCR
ncbi:MAG TPA: hypothetical protein VFU21_02290 [Kofleriaceae bacterium]|nr:hypothetical protein [Kofleriaceae bacterium]